MVTVRFGRWLARLEAGSWSSPDKELEGSLNELHPNGVSSAWPDPELRMAKDAVAAFGGQIVEYLPEEGEAAPKGVEH